MVRVCFSRVPSQNLYTLPEGIMISVKSLQRSEGDVPDPIRPHKIGGKII